MTSKDAESKNSEGGVQPLFEGPWSQVLLGGVGVERPGESLQEILFRYKVLNLVAELLETMDHLNNLGNSARGSQESHGSA